MKKVFIIIGVVIVLVAGFLALPSNYYLRQALIHLHPKIDQFPIFDNRVVVAADPVPWPVAEGYNRLSLPEDVLPEFEELETVAYVVIQDGKLLFEEYWDGYSERSHSNSFSMAKSIVSLAVGCAIDDGFIESVDQPVQDFYPEFAEYNGKTLTIRHLLTMSAGVDFQEAYTSPFSPTTKLYYGNDLQKVTFDMKMIEEPGVNFVYQSGVTQLLTFIVEMATGEPISDYVSRRLWSFMGAEETAVWSLDKKDGIEKAYCCFNSNARDFARFGQLILNEGRWGRWQLVSAEYMKEATTPDRSLIYKEYNTPNTVYGFQFWNLAFEGMRVIYMRGILGQYVFAIPEKNAVIVRLGKKRSEEKTAQHYPADIDLWLSTGMRVLDAAEKLTERADEAE
ncbi:CubicO group peptidase (beta-lactamase class C family) [Parabacteroides sp. PFB2-12]|uniref:serine hydrolase domain-containing protein n=1 Tax=unclassified Parabacteroides TaxID=2649774 RepID=UPI0024747AE0|nr:MULTISPECIES: serine hydrolase [unclassified Parabacteroides]MDH6342297.1 CubicO group peptidase (beta-lactamase class C family) [Parabacteroides sp. PM6-13]MDH6390640.1 CubicO group peptidase (beta-lactamase class C family) [Parabacteroides sp. PFB2-12]